MIHTRKKCLAVLIWVCVSMSVSAVHGQPPLHQKPPVLSLAPDTTQISPYEPLYVRVAMRNTSSEPLTIRASIFMSIELHIAYEDEPRLVKIPGQGLDMDAVMRPFEIVPGGSVETTKAVFLYPTPGLNPGTFTFDKIGTYRLKAQTFLSPNQKIESQEIRIEVQRPSPEDIATAKLITQPGAARMIQGWNMSDEAGAALLQKAADEFPTSKLADHARFSLAQYFNFLHSKYQHQDKKPVEAAEAARESFAHYAAVSNRIANLKTRSVIAQTDLVRSSPTTWDTSELTELLGELKVRADKAMLGTFAQH